MTTYEININMSVVLIGFTPEQPPCANGDRRLTIERKTIGKEI